MMWTSHYKKITKKISDAPNKYGRLHSRVFQSQLRELRRKVLIGSF